MINFREGSLSLYLVIALSRSLLCLSFSSIIGLGIDLDGVLRHSVAFDVFLCPVSSC
jgi:hypothetical protein